MQRLFPLLLLKAIIFGVLIAISYVGLSPDEAQYWTWSRALDWGYYSKPPGIAWQIGSTTALFGNNEFGVRFGALVIGFLIPIAVYYLARNAALQERGAFWAAVAMAFSPLGVYLSFAATTDGGAILFLILAIALLIKENYLLAGLAILCGALFKWTAFVLWPFAILFILIFPKMRKWSLLGGILISLLAFLPPLYWNVTHEWATFKHVGGAIGKVSKGKFFEFFAAQIGLLSPVYFALLIAAFFRKMDRPLYICAAFPFAVIVYLVAALFKKIQPNWAAYLYPAGMVLIAWVAYPRYKSWLHIGTWLSIALVCIAFLFPWYTFRQAVGWNHLTPALEKSGYHPETDFLFGDKYQTASILSFYGPEQNLAYFFNISHTRKNQFSYWPQMEEREVGKTGYFVVLEKTKDSSWYEAHYLNRLSPYFGSVTFVGAYPLYETKTAMIFRCVNYLGEAPLVPNVSY